MAHLLLSCDLVKPLACRCVDCGIARVLLPAANRDINVDWVDLDAAADAPDAFSCHQSGARAQEGIEHYFAANRAIKNRVSYHGDGFHGWMESQQIAFIA